MGRFLQISSNTYFKIEYFIHNYILNNTHSTLLTKGEKALFMALPFHDKAILLLAQTTQEDLEQRFYNAYPEGTVYFFKNQLETVFNGPYDYTKLGRWFYHIMTTLLRRYYQLSTTRDVEFRLKIEFISGYPIIAGIGLRVNHSFAIDSLFGPFTPLRCFSPQLITSLYSCRQLPILRLFSSNSLRPHKRQKRRAVSSTSK